MRLIALLIGLTMAVPALAANNDNIIKPNEDNSASGTTEPGATKTPAPQQHQKIYRMRDKNGDVIFTDNPPKGSDAVQIHLQPSNSVPMPKASPQPAAGKQPQQQKKQAVHYRVTIASPTDKETFQNPDKPVDVTVQVEPTLRKGDKLRLLYDGKPMDGTSIKRPERGTHTVSAEVVDANGKVLGKSGAHTFYVHRHSRLLPPK